MSGPLGGYCCGGVFLAGGEGGRPERNALDAFSPYQCSLPPPAPLPWWAQQQWGGGQGRGEFLNSFRGSGQEAGAQTK